MAQQTPTSDSQRANKALTSNRVFLWLLVVYVVLQAVTLLMGFLHIPGAVLLTLIGGLLSLAVLIVAIVVHVRNTHYHLPTIAPWLIYLTRVLLIATSFISRSSATGQLFSSAMAWLSEVILLLATIFAYLAMKPVQAALATKKG